MRGEAMLRLVNKLTDTHFYNLPLNEYHGLEFFARKGNWQTLSYVDRVKSIDAWEIDPLHENDLRKNLPSAIISIGDSFTLAKDHRVRGKYNFIVIDNPQNIYSSYCEHFEALKLIPSLLNKDGGVVVFNVNLNPFDHEINPEWMERRKQFYGKCALSLDHDFIIDFYHKHFLSMGLEVKFIFEEKRNDSYLSYIVVGL